MHPRITDIQKLLEENKKLKEILLQLQKENSFLREKFELAQRRKFGASSEKAPLQTDWLFNEAETLADAADAPPEVPAHDAAAETLCKTTPESAATTTPRKKTGRKPLPTQLPRETRVVDIPDAEKICPCCNGQLHSIGEEKSEQLEYIPASLRVIEILRLKYACRGCEKTRPKHLFLLHPCRQAPFQKA
jgi:transposase